MTLADLWPVAAAWLAAEAVKAVLAACVLAGFAAGRLAPREGR